jgi:hypothetical protein
MRMPNDHRYRRKKDELIQYDTTDTRIVVENKWPNIVMGIWCTVITFSNIISVR